MDTQDNGFVLSREGEATLKMILNRRSVRNYVPEKPLSTEILYELVKAGMAAPSAKNQQPWAFVAINDHSILTKLAGILPHGKMLAEAGGAIVVCGDMTNTLEGSGGDFWIQDCSAAAENIMLAAEAFGIGSVWIGVYPNKFIGVENVMKMNKLLNLPGNVIALNVISLGYPASHDTPKNKYNEEKIHHNTWK
ncbi:MAG: nitroreductase family protein [Bacteroidales bacterium]|jgi:nitroreductase|nr:nitroreductase family protein [Bacteroidales bacterium]